MIKKRNLALGLMSSTMLCAAGMLVLPEMALAQDKKPANETEIIVTATKRSESLQKVPVSIQAITTKKLDQLNVANFNDYAAMLPASDSTAWHDQCLCARRRLRR